MNRIIAAFYLGMCCWMACWGQTQERPPWVNGTFPDVRNGFEYRVTGGDAPTLSEARAAALSDFLAQISSLAGVEITYDVISELENINGNEAVKFRKNTVIKGKGVNVAFVEASEYYESCNYRYQVWKLYELSTTAENFKPYIPQYTTTYGVTAAWRSAIIPGWGQFYKGKIAKGVIFLPLEAVAVSGVVVCEMKRSYNFRKSNETSDLNIVKTYRSRADNWALYRNVAVGAAVGIYVWNVLDAALAKGKVRYAWLPDNVHVNAFPHHEMCYYGVEVRF